MAATVSSVWSKPGAWALDSEQHEDELNSQHHLDLSAASKLPSPPAADFPSLSAAVTTTKPKKKSKQTLSLAEFSNYKPPSASASAPADIVLPTGPRERTAEEIAESRRGGFRNYGGAERGDRDRPRVSREDRDMGSSRADDADDWSKAKKFPSFGSGGSERDSGFSRADEVDDWSKGKKFGGGFGAERGERREKMGFFGSSRADDVDNWATTKRPTGPGAEVDSWAANRRDRKVGFEATGPGADVDNWVKNKDIGSGSASGGGRPRLNLQPRTLPVVPDNKVDGKVSGVEVGAVVEGGKAKGNPFGAARPREEVLKEKGQDWKEIEEKLEAVKMKEVERGSSFDSIGRRRGFGLAGNRPDASAAPDDRTSVRAWRKPESMSNAAAAVPAPTPTPTPAPSTTPIPSAETGEKGDDERSGSSEKASEDN